MSEVLDYDALVGKFEDGLINNLRRHGVGDDFLEMWVPDPDPVKGILNMVDAADCYGIDHVAIRVGLATLPEGRHAELEAALSEIGSVTVSTDGDAILADIHIGGSN